MSSFEELRNIRIEKLKLLEKAGLNPYPAKSQKDYFISEVIDRFEDISKKESIHLVGRIMAVRGQGALIFININDGSGIFQGLLKKDEMEEEIFDLFQNTIDIGDFISVSGKVDKTSSGEISVFAGAGGAPS